MLRRIAGVKTTACFALSFFGLVLFSARSFAGDWPQILGESRNGHAVNEKLAPNWKDAKPKQSWSYSVGKGYAGPAIAKGRVYVFHREGNNDDLTCVSAENGKKIWSTSWPAAYRGGIDSDTGPRCVPLISKDQVYVFSAAGDLHCTDSSGKKVWSRRLAKDYKAQDGYFGFGSTPLIIGDRIMVNVGGKDGASIVGLDLATGKTKWKQFDDAASYAAPIAWSAGSQSPIGIFITRLNVVALEPTNGKMLFQIPFGARGPTVNAATPIQIGEDQLFVTASYRIGAKAFSINGEETKVIWENDTSLSSQYPTPVFRNAHLYGIHGREDGAAASLRCVDAKTGTVKWEERGVGMAHLIAADGKLLMQTVEGELVLLNLDAAKYTELGRVRISTSTTRALPAFSNGQLIARDTGGNLTAWAIPQ